MGICPSFLIFAQAADRPRAGGSDRSGADTREMTAQEYVSESNRLFQAGDYAGAAALYGRFAADFGESPDAAPAIPATRFRHAICFVRLGRFPEAERAITDALGMDPPLQPAEREELQFWLGVCKLEGNHPAAARAELEKYLACVGSRPAGAATRKLEAGFLIGSTWLQEGDPDRAAACLEELGAEAPPALRSTASLMILSALLEKNRNDEATRLAERIFSGMETVSRVAAFQSLFLELGSRWAEAGEFRKAIACYQRIWPSERIRSHQNRKLAELESQLGQAGPDAWRKRELAQLVAQVREDIASFEKISDFDTALRLRLSSAYQSMGRHREAALIIEELLRRQAPTPLLEQAAVHLVQTWFLTRRWSKVAESAAAFRAKFLSSSQAPLITYLEATAAQKAGRFDEALGLFVQLANSRPASEFTPRAAFQHGITLLLAGRSVEACGIFDEFGKSHPDHEMAEAAGYWRGMALSMAGRHADAREALDEYLARFREGPNKGAALFRKAYCAQQAEDFRTSIRELRAFLKAYPHHANSNEARILLGDALLSEGDIGDGLRILSEIPPDDTRCHEEATFKIARALKVMEEYDRLLELMQGFLRICPESSRAAEAVLQIAWAHRQQNRPAQAREACWEAVRKYGDNPAACSVEQLFPELEKSYGAEEAAAYLKALQELRAASPARTTLRARSLWAEARALRKADPARSGALLVEAADLANVQSAGPSTLVDFAVALRAAGREPDGLRMYRELLRWYPRAPQKSRALAELGFAELAAGNEAAAMGWFDRFSKEAKGSPLAGKVLLARGDLHERNGKFTEARQDYENLLAETAAAGQEKAAALYRIGEIHMRAGNPRLAIPYFQRIYVLHARWSDWVAKAYARSAEAFEKLDDPESARKTYEELASKEELSEFAEAAAARRKLESLRSGETAKEDPRG